MRCSQYCTSSLSCLIFKHSALDWFSCVSRSNVCALCARSWHHHTGRQSHTLILYMKLLQTQWITTQFFDAVGATTERVSGQLKHDEHVSNISQFMITSKLHYTEETAHQICIFSQVKWRLKLFQVVYSGVGERHMWDYISYNNFGLISESMEANVTKSTKNIRYRQSYCLLTTPDLQVIHANILISLESLIYISTAS